MVFSLGKESYIFERKPASLLIVWPCKRQCTWTIRVIYRGRPVNHEAQNRISLKTGNLRQDTEKVKHHSRHLDANYISGTKYSLLRVIPCMGSVNLSDWTIAPWAAKLAWGAYLGGGAVTVGHNPHPFATSLEKSSFESSKWAARQMKRDAPFLFFNQLC